MWQSKYLFFQLLCGFSTIIIAIDQRNYEKKTIFTNKEIEIRFFGWSLLGIWLSTIIYMTRDFFFPSMFHENNFETSSQILQRLKT